MPVGAGVAAWSGGWRYILSSARIGQPIGRSSAFRRRGRENCRAIAPGDPGLSRQDVRWPMLFVPGFIHACIRPAAAGIVQSQFPSRRVK
jgi:hypothetical protein